MLARLYLRLAQTLEDPVVTHTAAVRGFCFPVASPWACESPLYRPWHRQARLLESTRQMTRSGAVVFVHLARAITWKDHPVRIQCEQIRAERNRNPSPTRLPRSITNGNKQAGSAALKRRRTNQISSKCPQTGRLLFCARPPMVYLGIASFLEKIDSHGRWCGR